MKKHKKTTRKDIIKAMDAIKEKILNAYDNDSNVKVGIETHIETAYINSGFPSNYATGETYYFQIGGCPDIKFE